MRCALLAALANLLACGGDERQRGRGQITEAIETSVTSTDPADCTELQTQRFVEQTNFETGETALQECENDAADTPRTPTRSRSATSRSTGPAPRPTSPSPAAPSTARRSSVALVKEGDQWKLDEITDIPEFDSAAFRQTLLGRDPRRATSRPMSADCIVQAFAQTDDETLKSTFLSGDGEQLNALFAECIPS